MVAAKRPGAAFFLFLACFALLGLLRSPDAHWNRLRVPRPPLGEDKFPCVVRVRTTFPFLLGGEKARVRVDSVAAGYAWLEGRYVLLRGPGIAGALGDGTATVRGTFYYPRPRLNPYGWDTELRYGREGIAGTLLADSFADSAGRMPALFRYRERIARLIASAGNRSSRGVLEALLLGRRTEIDPSTGDIMIRAGTYHVIAISGLHVGIVVLLVTSLITAMGPPRGLRILLAVVCVLGYVVFTGARPSAQRAGAFFLLLSLIKYIQWKVDIPNCVCAAGIILLALSPHLAWDVGFRLSLGAVFGITLLVPQLQSAGRRGKGLLGRLGRYVRLGVLVSFSAQAATLPILLYHFGRVSLAGTAFNLVVLPVVTLAVAAGLEASLAVLVWERLGLVFMRGAAALVTLMIAVASLAQRWFDPVVFAGRPEIWQLIIYCIGISYIGFLTPRLKGRWKILGLVLLYAFLLLPMPRSGERGMVLTFVHVGDGDACLVRFPGGPAMLIDTGQGGEYDAGRMDVLPHLAIQGVKRLDSVLITHSHNDHYGGLAALLGNIDVNRVLVGTLEGEAGYRELLERCRARGIEVELVARGDTVVCGGAALEVLHPSGVCLQRADDPNAQSIVLRLVYKEIRVLFTGDVTPGVQRELADLGCDLACDVLKVPHHGAPDGVDPAFVEACGAEVAVISVGSRFASHPSPGTIRLLEDSGMRVLVTRRDGAVTVTTEGRNLEIRTVKGGRVSVPGRLPHLLDAQGLN
jgi:competence protein ComEC